MKNQSIRVSFENLAVRIREKSLYCIALTGFWIVLYLICDPLQGSDSVNLFTWPLTVAQGDNQVLSELTQGEVYSQTFTAEENDLTSVQVCATTFGRVNDCRVQITAQDQSGKILYDEVSEASGWQDNGFLSIPLQDQEDSAGKEYTVTFKGLDGTEGNAPAVLTVPVSGEMPGVVVNHVEQEAAFLMKATFCYPGLKTVFICCMLLLVLLSYVFVLWMDGLNEKTFSKYSICLGALFLLFNPFYHPLDEHTHFFRSLCISQNEWLDTMEDGKIGGYVPENMAELGESGEISIKSFFIPQISSMQISDRKEFYVHPYMSSVIPTNHAIAAAGIWIARILGLNALGAIFLGRAFDYLYYVVLCYFAIRNAKYYKSAFFVIAALPLSHWLAASYSIDPVLLANSLLFVSICLKYHMADERMQISWKELGVLLFCGIWIASVKYCIYTPVLLVYFLIPRECFTKKQYRVTLILAVCGVLGMVLWQLQLLRQFPFTEDRNGHVDMKEQVLFMLQHPGATVRIFTTYFFNSMEMHLSSFQGYNGVVAPVGAMMSFLSVLSAVLMPDRYSCRDRKEKNQLLFLFLFIILMVYGLTIVALYVGFTPVGKYEVEGVQTRYLLPILIFVMLLLSRARVKNEIRDYGNKLVFMQELSLLLCLSGALLQAF